MRRILLAIAALVATGCAWMSGDSASSEDAVIWGDATEILELPPEWQMKGKFAYRSPHDNQTAQLVWHQLEQNFEVRLFGPLGFGSVSVEGDPSSVRIQKGQEVWSSDRPQQLIYQTTGMWVPFVDLPTVLTGRSDAEVDDWQVEYQGWEIVDGYRLPSRIKLTYEAFELLVIISDWQI